MSKFLGAQINLTPGASAALSLEVGLVKGLLSACMTGRLDGFAELADTAADMSKQAVANPTSYRSPYKILRP
jgi:hypothetical protein